MVEQVPRDVRPVGDVVERELGEALFGDDRHRRGDQLLAACIAVIAATLAVAVPARADLHYLPHHLAVETNHKYGHDCFWAPPKGMDYGDLPNAIPIQKPNLYPDVGSTYFVAQYKLPRARA